MAHFLKSPGGLRANAKQWKQTSLQTEQTTQGIQITPTKTLKIQTLIALWKPQHYIPMHKKKVWRDLPLQDIHGSRLNWSGICGVCLHLGVKWIIIQSVSVRGTQWDWDGVISQCFPHKCVFFSKLVCSNSSLCDSFCFDMFTHWLGFEAWCLVCRKRQRHPTLIHHVIMSHETPGVKGSRCPGWHRNQISIRPQTFLNGITWWIKILWYFCDIKESQGQNKTFLN